MIRPMPGLLALAMAAATLGVACEEKRPSSTKPLADAGASAGKYATEDPKLAKAIQAAASAAPASDDGPPPTGVFAPGVADKRHPKGVPTKVDLVSEGDAPRVSLAVGPADAARTSSYGPAGLEIGTQMGPRMALPTIDLTMVLGPAKKDDGGTDWLVADVKKAQPAREQFGELPPGTDKEIASLGGTQLRVKMDANGSESEEGLVLSRNARPELERLAATAAEAIVLASIPLPAKPVGVGAQWIAETRMPLGGLDVIAYRAFRVKSITDNRLHLTVEVKGYAAAGDTHFPGVPSGAKLVQVDAEAQGEMEMVRGEVLARKSDVQQRLVMVFQAPGTKAPPRQTLPNRKTSKTLTSPGSRPPAAR